VTRRFCVAARAIVKPRDVTGQIVDLSRFEEGGLKQDVGTSLDCETSHVHGPIDHLTVAFDRVNTTLVTGDRNHVEIHVCRKPSIQPELCVAGFPSLPQ
jgi:hypothetical protein